MRSKNVLIDTYNNYLEMENQAKQFDTHEGIDKYYEIKHKRNMLGWVLGCEKLKEIY
jgi:hypothetical protein